MLLGSYTHDEFMEVARQFHGYPAPGIIVGAYMTMMAVNEVQPYLGEDKLFNAISETVQCLPDAIQILTPCTVGNGWLKICHNGRYSMSLFDKYTGRGVRVYIDYNKLDKYPGIKEWLMKERPKREQDTENLQAEIRAAKTDILSVEAIQATEEYYGRHGKGGIHCCAYCNEPIPKQEGILCKVCQGDSPYVASKTSEIKLRSVPVEEAVGQVVLHDMTRIVAKEFKGVQVKAGTVLSVGDMCELQRMGKNHIYIADSSDDLGQQAFDQDTLNDSAERYAENLTESMHENDCAKRLATMLGGDNVSPVERIREGKISFIADCDGILWLDEDRLKDFNSTGDIVAVTRRQACIVKKGEVIASSRAIPLYLSKKQWLRAENIVYNKALFSILPLSAPKVGILITGTEVYNGTIEDKFEGIIKPKLDKYNCSVVDVLFASDDSQKISEAVMDLRAKGAELIITTAGMSVDPDDVTRKGLVDAGLHKSLYGVPILPGSMSLLGELAENAEKDMLSCKVIGVPACALFHSITAFDVLLRLVLANAPYSRDFFAGLGAGGLCENCTNCTYPKCRFAL